LITINLIVNLLTCKVNKKITLHVLMPLILSNTEKYFNFYAIIISLLPGAFIFFLLNNILKIQLVYSVISAITIGVIAFFLLINFILE